MEIEIFMIVIKKRKKINYVVNNFCARQKENC